MRAIELVLLGAVCASQLTAADDHLNKGIALFQEGRYASALPELEQAKKEGSGIKAQVYVALTQAATNHCPQALPVLNEQAQHVDSEWGKLAALAAAKCDQQAGDSIRALELLDELKHQYPNDADVLYLSAETEMKAFNDATFAMFQRTPSSYRVHQLSAEILEIQNRYPDAIAEWQKAIETSGGAPDLHYRLGRALLLESHSPEALQKASAAFAQELAISPEDSASEFQLGQIAQVGGQNAAAEAHFAQALKLTPDFVSAMIALGKMYVGQKQYPEAITLLKRATEMQPENEAAHYALLTAYRDNGERSKALEEKAVLDRLQKPPEGEFSQFLKKLGSAGQPSQ